MLDRRNNRSGRGFVHFRIIKVINHRVNFLAIIRLANCPWPLTCVLNIPQEILIKDFF
jgi:hypothetical protein